MELREPYEAAAATHTAAERWAPLTEALQELADVRQPLEVQLLCGKRVGRSETVSDPTVVRLREALDRLGVEAELQIDTARDRRLAAESASEIEAMEIAVVDQVGAEDHADAQDTAEAINTALRRDQGNQPLV
jgi:hypothetical protein